MTNAKNQKQLSLTDRLLLDEVQRRFPICERPFARIGERLNLSESGVLRRLRRYKAQRLIRRIGPVFDARRSGLIGTLVALAVPSSRVKAAAECINSFDGVTHNYLRSHSLNIWFTLTCHNRAVQKTILEEIKSRVTPRQYLELPANKIFKLGVIFDLGVPMKRKGCDYIHKSEARRLGNVASPSSLEKLSTDIPIVERPFPRGTVGAIRYLISSGRIRRFGAILDGRRLGLRFNALVAWQVEQDRIDSVGLRFASLYQVSHCYARQRTSSWPYDVYTMIHVRDRRLGARLVADMARAAGITDHVVLETARELKRSSIGPVHKKIVHKNFLSTLACNLI